VLVLGPFARGQGNPVRIRGCPAAVSENDVHHMHWPPTLGLGSGRRRKAARGRSARKSEDLPASDAGEKSDDGFDLEASREAGRSVLARVMIDQQIDQKIDSPASVPDPFPPVFQ
jgi:hypothetical protein